MDGFDISLGQCPPAELLPEGCSVRQLDVLGDLPENLQGVYDIVHLRLFMSAIKDDDPVPLIQNVMAMLSS